MNDLLKLRRIMRQANLLTNQSPANGNRSYAMRVSHRMEDIRTDLHNGYLHFQYVKADGSHRVALGTLNPALIPADKMPGASSRKTGGAASAEKGDDYRQRLEENRLRLGLISYYDLNKDEWRSFYFFSLVDNDDEHTDRYKPVPLNL